MLEYDQSSVPLREMLKCPKTKRRRTPKHSQSANTHYSKELIPLQPQNRQWGFIQGIVVQILPLLSVVCKSEWSRSEDVFFCHETVLLSFRNNFFTQASVIVYLANPTPTVNLTVVTKVPFKIRPFRNEKKTGKSKFSQGLLGVLLGTREKNWPITDWLGPTNNPRNHCGIHLGSRLLPVSKVANLWTPRLT